MKSISGVVLRMAALTLFFFPVSSPAQQQAGPIGVMNQIPTHMLFLTPRPHAPQSLPNKTVRAALSYDYFSIYSNASSRDYRILMDMEATVVDLRLGYGLTERLSFWLRLPFVSMGDGFMDGVLGEYHSIFGMPNYGKERSPDNKFAYRIEKEGQALFKSKKGGLNLTDTTLSVETTLAEFEKVIPTQIGLTYELKLPMGDCDYGLGSGAFDHGVFLPTRLRFSRFNLYLMPGYIRIGTPQFETVNVSVRDIKSMLIAGEYLFSSHLSVLAQVNAYTSPFVDTGIVKLDSFSAELAVGMRYAFTRQVSLEFAFCEDLTRTAPDFNLHLTLHCKIS